MTPTPKGVSVFGTNRRMSRQRLAELFHTLKVVRRILDETRSLATRAIQDTATDRRDLSGIQCGDSASVLRPPRREGPIRIESHGVGLLRGKIPIVVPLGERAAEAVCGHDGRGTMVDRVADDIATETPSGRNLAGAGEVNNPSS